MKIAVLSDIHSNLPALKAVLYDLPPVDAYVCCGDLVGYYPDAEEVCDIFESLNFSIVRGNHDAYVIDSLQPNKDKTDLYKTEYTQRILSKKNLNWLNTLPLELKFLWDESNILIRHANPWDEETYIYPDSQLISEINLKKNDFLFLGHTHFPMWIKAGEGMILNPGSVGQPRDWNPQASYAVFDTEKLTADFRRVKYDVISYQKRLKQLGWDDAIIEILNRNKSN